MRHRGTRLRLGLASTALALFVAACGDVPALRVVNRTQTSVLVALSDSHFLVGACSERTVRLGDRRAYENVDYGDMLVEDAPPGASTVVIPEQKVARAQDSGAPEQVVMVTQDYLGIWIGIASWSPVAIAGTGTFPPDPGSVQCAGVPPSAGP